MDVTYGQGQYRRDAQILQGQMILGEHKLFLRAAGEDQIESFVPLDKITALVLLKKGLRLHVKPTLYFQYAVILEGESRNIRALAAELVRRRGLRKKWFKSEWVEEIS